MGLARDGKKVTETLVRKRGEGLPRHRPLGGTVVGTLVLRVLVAEESRSGDRVRYNAFLTGWIDGDSGKGRCVEGAPMAHG